MHVGLSFLSHEIVTLFNKRSIGKKKFHQVKEKTLIYCFKISFNYKDEELKYNENFQIKNTMPHKEIDGLQAFDRCLTV